MRELEAKVDGKSFACKLVIAFPYFFVFCSSLSADLFSGKKNSGTGINFWNYSLVAMHFYRKTKSCSRILAIFLFFLQKWIASREKFKKLNTMGHFSFFSVSRRIDPRSGISRKQKRSKTLRPTCTQRVHHLFLPLALTILKKLFETFLKIQGFEKSFTKLLLY